MKHDVTFGMMCIVVLVVVVYTLYVAHVLGDHPMDDGTSAWQTSRPQQPS